TTSFYGYSGSDSTQILFDIDKFRIDSNVRFKFNDTINSLDSSLFVIDKNGSLVLLNGTNSYEDQFSPYLNLVLDGGISMTPNNDGQYDTLLVESNIPLTSYYINVTDIAGDTLYESTNISLAWNAKEASGLLVPVGSYFYHITLNGKLTEGQFLVEY
ncbi:MAG: gliding motility-associated C-terminal domain-containing protein, partial [Bacteroidota bacterium]|nr:gliding motility-associated C-terminal domain-containing protein [Bacteroidota bacterium]